jgi:hypothetical protein
MDSPTSWRIKPRPRRSGRRLMPALCPVTPTVAGSSSCLQRSGGPSGAGGRSSASACQALAAPQECL